MHIAIIGAAGMVGRKLIARLVKDGESCGQDDQRPVACRCHHTVDAGRFQGQVQRMGFGYLLSRAKRKRSSTKDRMSFSIWRRSSPAKPSSISKKGIGINLDGTRQLFEAIRFANAEDGYKPRVVFTSSIAVFGAPFPAVIPDDFHLTPLTSYGAQKAMSEFLLADYSRRGVFDGIGLRLPTICVRPGKPNKAASGFFSGILREPLAGMEAVLPVPDTVRHWHASPRSAVGFLVHAAGVDLAPIGAQRSFSMPGVSATVGEQIEALRSMAGEAAVKLIRREPDEMVMKIVAGWAGVRGDKGQVAWFRGRFLI
jgi:nucleoside-diphosphate-sugar epimerase